MNPKVNPTIHLTKKLWAAQLLLVSSLMIGCDDSSVETSSDGAGESPSGEVADQSDLGIEERDAMLERDADVEPDAEVPAPYEHPEYAEEMLVLVNRFRAEGGTCGAQSLPSVPPLILDELLDLAARDHAADMAAKGYFDHNSPDGTTPSDRMRARGYRGQAYGENIAAGNESALETFTQWKNSPGHCVNMLSDSYTELGVGYVRAPFSNYQHFWVQNFGRPQ